MTLEQAERVLRPVYFPNIAKGSKLPLAEFLMYPADNLASPDNRTIALLSGLVDLFSGAREILGVPLRITSGYRTIKHNREIYGYERFSEHYCGAALDIDPSEIPARNHTQRCRALIHALVKAGEPLGLTRREFLRFGFKQYIGVQDIVHVGIAPILFAPQWRDVQNALSRFGNIFYPYGRENPCPKDWVGGAIW